MMNEKWNAVDHYFSDLLTRSDPILEAALVNSAEGGLPPHHVSAAEGKFLELIVQMSGARKVLEIGTLGAYSTIWLARGLPGDGHVITLEVNPDYAKVAATNIFRAGLDSVVDLRMGKAIESLSDLLDDQAGPFDLIFIDADKPSNPEYLEWCLRLSRPGTVIIGDNVVRDGTVADASSSDANVRGIRKFLDLISTNPRLSATAIQTVGSKGYDGFVLAIVGGND